MGRAATRGGAVAARRPVLAAADVAGTDMGGPGAADRVGAADVGRPAAAKCLSAAAARASWARAPDQGGRDDAPGDPGARRRGIRPRRQRSVHAAVGRPRRRATARRRTSRRYPRRSRQLLVTRTAARTTPRPSPSAGSPLGRATVAVASTLRANPPRRRRRASSPVISPPSTGMTISTSARCSIGRCSRLRQRRRFAAGFRSTTDSGAVLIGLSATRGRPPHRDRAIHQPSGARGQPGPLGVHALDHHAPPRTQRQRLPARRSARRLPRLTTGLLAATGQRHIRWPLADPVPGDPDA